MKCHFKTKKITNKLKIIDCDKHRNWRGPNPILTLQTLVALLYSSVVPKSHRRTDTRDSHSAKPRKWNRMNRAKKKIQHTRWWLHHNNSTYINVKRCYNKEIAQWARTTHTCAMATATLPHSQNGIYTRNLYILHRILNVNVRNHISTSDLIVASHYWRLNQLKLNRRRLLHNIVYISDERFEWLYMTHTQ